MTHSLPESYAYCKALAQRTARNFYYSFLTLPADGFRDMCVLYAFMRVCDDISDDESLPVDTRLEQLRQWRGSLERALAGEGFDHVLFPALADVVARHQIPREYLEAVIDGVGMDLQPGGFETFEDLRRYCYHVAGAVGLCCIHIWGFRDERARDAAVDCGIAFQLTNILRDLGEDAGRDRVYLPREDLCRFGYTESDLRNHLRNGHFVELMRFQVDRARGYFSAAERLFDYLEPAGKPVLSAMIRIYGGLLAQIEHHNYDVFARQIRLPGWRKAMISLDTIVRRRWLARP